jgi:GT2 family glycosyltransferase
MPRFAPEDVSVVIPTRARWDVLRQTMHALSDQSISGFEIVIVVDGTDQSVPVLTNARVIVKEHAGAAAARNTGANSSDRPLLLFLGDDMIPTPRLVELHLDRHNRGPEPEVAVLGHARWHPTVARDRLNRWLDWSSSQFDFAGIDGEDAGFGRFYSSNVSLKRRFFLDAGGFDEDFVIYYEDIDLGYRLAQRGMRLVYEPAAVTHHLHRYTWPDIIARFRGIAARERLMANKHDWFDPFFARRARDAIAAPSAARFWPYVVDLVPKRAGRWRSGAERRANAWYYQNIAPHFFDAWRADEDLEELRAYLGDAYDVGRLRNHVQEVVREHDTVGDEAAFYRTAESYLYDLTAFALSGTKVPYLRDLKALVGEKASLLDWGCGIGSDGLRLLADGYRVAFADFANPSTRFLKWRLDRRGLDAPVYDIESDEISSVFDAAYAFDVIEHVDDPFVFLKTLESRASVVMVNFLEPQANDPYPHNDLPITDLLAHAARRGLLRYRKYHKRSHLVAYRGDVSTMAISSIRSAIERRIGAHVCTA